MAFELPPVCPAQPDGTTVGGAASIDVRVAAVDVRSPDTSREHHGDTCASAAPRRPRRSPHSLAREASVIELVGVAVALDTRHVLRYTLRMALALTGQPSLFGCGDPSFDPTLTGIRRLLLTRGAWVDHLPAWVRGHEALFDALWASTSWRTERRWMYERIVDVPRLFAMLPEDGPGHPILADIGAALSAYYRRPLPEISLAAYRDGRDSVAFHGDRLGRVRADAVVAIVSLGEPRRFLLRPMGGGASHAFDLGWGDLLVMGGTCQRTWQHGVPKVACAGPRMSVQFRPDVSDEPGAERRRGQAVAWRKDLAPAAAARPAPVGATSAGVDAGDLPLRARAQELPDAAPRVG